MRHTIYRPNPTRAKAAADLTTLRFDQALAGQPM